MHRIGKYLLTGLITVLPLVATIAVVVWLASLAEGVAGSLVAHLLPEGAYRSGMGVLAGVLVLLLIGIFMELWFVQRLVSWLEDLVFRIPLVRPLYGAFRELLQFISRSRNEQGKKNRVVMVLFDSGIECLGLVTRERFQNLPPGIGSEDRIAVYLPMSYQVGGHTVIVPRSKVRSVDMTMDQAIRFSLTAGMSWKGQRLENNGL